MLGLGWANLFYRFVGKCRFRWGHWSLPSVWPPGLDHTKWPWPSKRCWWSCLSATKGRCFLQRCRGPWRLYQATKASGTGSSAEQSCLMSECILWCPNLRSLLWLPPFQYVLNHPAFPPLPLAQLYIWPSLCWAFVPWTADRKRGGGARDMPRNTAELIWPTWLTCSWRFVLHRTTPLTC